MPVQESIERLLNSLVLELHNCLLLLGCGFKCILRHSQRLLFVKVYIFCCFKCWFEASVFELLLLQSNLNTESILLYKTLKFYKNVTKIYRNALSELNPSGSDLISTSYFSFLTHFGYMVIAIPIHLSVYNCVCVCVSECVSVDVSVLHFWCVRV